MSIYTQLYVHCVWATWDRMPLITSEVEPRIYAVLAAKCKELACVPVAIGGMDDHVHMLIGFSSKVSIARLVGEMKGSSSHAITHTILPGAFFKWQGAYGAFTISKRSVPQVRSYILNQKARHADRKLLDELERCTDK